MAKVSSARPSSRQSQDGAARNTRSTRSSSREPQQQPTRTQGTASPAKQRKGRTAKTAPVLDPVTEDAAIEDDLQLEMPLPPIEEDVPHRVSYAHSAMSGTTAKTSFSQEEIADLDSDLMLQALPSLASTTQALADLLVPADPASRPIIRKEIRTHDSKYNKRYNQRIAALNLYKADFGSTEFIQPSIVLRALLGAQNINDVPPGPWRPDAVVYKTNLAVMLRVVLIQIGGDNDASEADYVHLATLDSAFATAIAGPGFRQAAFQLSLAILTQLAILSVRLEMVNRNFDAEQVVVNTFYRAVEDDGERVFRHLHSLNMLELPADDQAEYSDEIKLHVDGLIAVFAEVDPVAALGVLRARHPWQGFIDLVTNYYLERKLELDEQMDAVGGVDQIMHDLNAEVERRELARQAQEKRQSFMKPGGTPKRAFGKAGIQKLKEFEKRAAASTAPAPVTDPIAPMVDGSADPPELHAATQDDGWARMEDDEYPVQPINDAQSTARSSLAALRNVQRQNASKTKARSFIDPQPNATRVSFDDSQYARPEPRSSAVSMQAPYYQSPQRSALKRPLVEDDDVDFDPTQDQGFEVDTRDLTAADQRRRTAPQQRTSNVRQASIVMTSSVPATSVLPDSPVQPPSAKRPRKNPGSSIPPPMPSLDPDNDVPMSTHEELQRAKNAARDYTAFARQNKPTQVRRPWTNEEDLALLDLIAEHCDDGIRYANLKAIDSKFDIGQQLLDGRSAEDFRFRARNLKEMYLKGRNALPRNLDKVVLDRKAIDKLRALGVDYQQERRRGVEVVHIQ